MTSLGLYDPDDYDWAKIFETQESIYWIHDAGDSAGEEQKWLRRRLDAYCEKHGVRFKDAYNTLLDQFCDPDITERMEETIKERDQYQPLVNKYVDSVIDSVETILDEGLFEEGETITEIIAGTVTPGCTEIFDFMYEYGCYSDLEPEKASRIAINMLKARRGIEDSFNVAVGAGCSFNWVPASHVKDIGLKPSGQVVDLGFGRTAHLLVGSTYEESRKIDRVLDKLGELPIREHQPKVSVASKGQDAAARANQRNASSKATTPALKQKKTNR